MLMFDKCHLTVGSLPLIRANAANARAEDSEKTQQLHKTLSASPITQGPV